LEVKRTYVTSQKVRYARKKTQRFLPKLEKKDFLHKVSEAKKKVNKMREKQLDKFIGDEWKKRLKAYDEVEWYLAKASTRELGVWRKAGSLPPSWTCCSLYKTVQLVKKGLAEKSKHIKARSKRAVPRIMEFGDIIAKEKRLYPIAFQGGTGTRGRKRCQTKVKGDLDDGCMRSIALAVSGRKTLDIYFGKPKKKG